MLASEQWTIEATQASALRRVTQRDLKAVARHLAAFVLPRYRTARLGREQWLRAAITPDTRTTFEALGPPRLAAVEISGANWAGLPWKSHHTLDYPAFDLCEPPEALPGPFDLVICEQVLEHVRDPLTAVKTLRRLCTPEGHVFVATPFLVRLHGHPQDFWRFTPLGMETLLRSQGLQPLWIRSWGNRRVAIANFNRWVVRMPWQTLRNEPDLPVVVWSLAVVDPEPRA